MENDYFWTVKHADKSNQGNGEVAVVSFYKLCVSSGCVLEFSFSMLRLTVHTSSKYCHFTISFLECTLHTAITRVMKVLEQWSLCGKCHWNSHETPPFLIA